jgi:hypothetical protein
VAQRLKALTQHNAAGVRGILHDVNVGQVVEPTHPDLLLTLAGLRNVV